MGDPLLDKLNRENDLIYHDPKHRDNTRAFIGREPTDKDLLDHWFGSGAHTRTKELLWGKSLIPDSSNGWKRID